MSSRELILGRLRASCASTAPPQRERPAGAEGETAAAPLGWEDFRQALAEADGEVHAAVALRDLPAALARLAGGETGYAPAAAALLGQTAAPEDPAALDGRPFFVATGRLAVARTGSTLVTQREVPARVQLLMPETLILLVPENSLVDDLPEVYASLDPETLARGYFTLISGPSRTADIEQTLVTGAHGPRRLVVIPYFS